MFIVLISPWVQQTAQFTPLVSELSLIRSHLLWGEFSAFSAANAISQFSIFSFHQVPITAGWTEAFWYERFCPTPPHTSNFSDLRELVTLPCATICVRPPYAHLVIRFNNRNMRIVKRFNDEMISIITTCAIWRCA